MSSQDRATTLLKTKLPGMTDLRYDAVVLGDDRHGTWLLLPRGTRWSGPHDSGVLPHPAVVLLPRDRPWVAWWVPGPECTELRVDVCRPAWHDEFGWRFVDLELDVIQDRTTGEVRVVDEPDLAARVSDGSVPEAEALLVRATAEAVAGELRSGTAAWARQGWDLVPEEVGIRVVAPTTEGEGHDDG